MNILKRHFSLKSRIFIFFFGILLLMICTYIFAISRFITRFAEERLDADYASILTETCDTMENLLWNLTLTSQQLLENEDIYAYLLNYRSFPNLYSRKVNYSNLFDAISSLTMSNTDIALMYFYDAGREEFIYSSFPADKRTNTTPVLYENSAFRFQGPCKSQSSLIGNPVLVLNRTETLSNGNKITLSIESGYYSLNSPFHSAERKSAYLAFTNSKNDIIYTTFPKDWDEKEILNNLSSDSGRNFRSFSKQSSQGWTAHIVIPASVYTRDYNLAIRDFAFYTVLIGILVGFFALYFWRSIYHPLQLFDKQLNILLSNDVSAERMHSSIPEYEHLLHKIVLLQKQIQEMIQQIIVQEKLHTKMQLEKLRAQINPHFLMNTLNTIHWMALINHQPDIDKITQSLSHLLSYNLDKESYYTNLKSELAALQEYVNLQKVRYTFHFEIQTQNGQSDLNYPCPKFIFQPLVENALNHGYREQMDIILDIQIKEWIEIKIQDTGLGIDENILRKLKSLAPVTDTAASRLSDQIHSGIGLQYVIQSLNDFYNGKYEFAIHSIKNEGTVILLKIPKLKGSGYHA